MSEHDILIERIMTASGIVGRARKSDTARELRSHIEDIIEEEREAGRSEQEIEHLVFARFGKAEQISEEFSVVYGPQRIAWSLLSYSLLALMSVFAVAGFVYAIQYGVAIWLGFSTASMFARPHLGLETALLAGMTLGYLSLYFTERLFTRKRFVKAFGLTSTGVAGTTFFMIGLGFGGAMPLLAGFVFAVFVRAIELIFARSALRLLAPLSFLQPLEFSYLDL